jgi:hypothetical protein
MHRIVTGTMLAGCALLLAAGPVGAVESRDFARAAAAARVGAGLRLENVQVADTGEARAFVLERFQVFASDAKVTIHGRRGQTVVTAPANVYFRGEVEGKPGSRVFLAQFEDGTFQGVVREGGEDGEMYLIGGDGLEAKAVGAGPLQMHRVDPAALKASRGQGFSCANEQLPPGGHGARIPGLDLDAVAPGVASAASAEKDLTAAAAYTARVAVETDFEFYQRFNNTTAATNYVGNLIGYASTIYSAQINTSLVVQSVSLWTTASDPWDQTTPTCGLMEFGRYWNLNRTNVSRTIAHFMSGKANGGGIAWLGVLCSGAFPVSTSCPGLPTDAPWGGGYGYTGSMSGSFNVNNPTVVWDIVAVAHEIGHNFNSPHTHCYNGIGGNASPVDQCRSGESGCYSGTQSLPGPAGAGSGTIMSYCHLLSPGMSNISLTFGTGHPYGVQPGRVPSRMSSYVQSVAAGNASCLAPVAPPPPPSTPGIFTDGFESGTLTSWN